jgi:hypothetical protein
VPDRFQRFAGDLKDIHLQHLNEFLPLRFFQWNKIVPSGVLVAYESPINPENEIEEKDKSCNKVDKPYGPEPVREGSFRSALDCGRIAYDISCYAKDYDT